MLRVGYTVLRRNEKGDGAGFVVSAEDARSLHGRGETLEVKTPALPASGLVDKGRKSKRREALGTICFSLPRRVRGSRGRCEA